MKLDRITITGADDSVKVADLLDLAEDFPFVEWGILVSARQEGGPRFPSAKWMRALLDTADCTPMRLSMHVCGRWVRDLLEGRFTLLEERPEWLSRFQRVQLNFHGQPHSLNSGAFFSALSKVPERQIIFQLDGTKNEQVFFSALQGGFDAVGLFDLSGGAGMLPAKWPKPYVADQYVGYAGGLGPENLESQLWAIEKAAGSERVWVDMETRVRSADDTALDLKKVRQCLKIASIYGVALPEGAPYA